MASKATLQALGPRASSSSNSYVPNNTGGARAPKSLEPKKTGSQAAAPRPGSPEWNAAWTTAFQDTHGGQTPEQYNAAFAPPSAPTTTPSLAAPTGLATNQAYADALNVIGLKRDNDIASLQRQRQSVVEEYGIDDTSNPFSKAKLLEQTYTNSQRGTTNSMAAAGQLYAGSLQNSRDSNQQSYLGNQDSMKRAYGSALDQIDTAMQDARYQAQYNSALAQAQLLQDRVNSDPPSSAPAPAPYQAQPLPQPNSTGPSGWGHPDNWMQVFKNTHGGLTPDEYNYLQALYKAQNG